jgi:hypothetical protein
VRIEDICGDPVGAGAVDPLEPDGSVEKMTRGVLVEAEAIGCIVIYFFLSNVYIQ